MIGRTKKYKNVKDEEIKRQTLEEIKKFVEEQKNIILELDKDVEHTALYNSHKWKEINQLSIDEIIDNPREFEKKINEIKLETIDRNFQNVYKATQIKQMIEMCFQINDINTVDENKRFLATVGEHSKGKRGKFLGIIDSEEFQNVKAILAYRQKAKEITSIEAIRVYIEKLRKMEQGVEYTRFINLLNETQNHMQNMQINKLKFSEKCESQIRQILQNNNNLKCEELQLSLYMMIFSQYFDDKNPLEVLEDDIQRITQKVWIEQEGDDNLPA